MGEARAAGKAKHHEQRLANATYTATEVEALTRTATYLGKKMGRVEAAEDLIVAIEEAALNIYGSRYGMHEAVEVVEYYILNCKDGDL